MADQAAWIEWAVQNLAQGVKRDAVAQELTANGFTLAEADAALASLDGNPVYRAAQRLGADLRKWTSLGDALLELQEQDHDFTRIPRHRGMTGAAFHHDFYARNLPVIIEDFATNWPALQRWTMEFLSEQYGSEQVTYQTGRGDRDYRHAFIHHETMATLAEYIDLVTACGETNDHYMIAHDRLLDRASFSGLFADMHFDGAILDPDDTLGRVFFWLGPKGAITPLHRDLGNVFLVQIMGRKEVTMIPALELHKVYNEHGYHSEIDFEMFDPAVHPLLSKARIARDVVAPGEMLFIPMGWWHHIKALDPVITITGNNFKFSNAFTAIF